MDFEVIEHGQEMASFILRSTPETLEKYPFDFELVISYELGTLKAGCPPIEKNISSSPVFATW